MAGSIYSCDKEVLQPGAPCIIEVDDVNAPTGLWWGEVTEEGAKITGGRVAFTSTSEIGGAKPVRSDERRGTIPHLNYRIYPDNETTQHLFWKLLYTQERCREADRRTAGWQKAHENAIQAAVGAAYAKGAASVPNKEK